MAVKVRHPGVGHAVVRDFGTMMYVAKIASKLPALRNLRLEDTLKQFAAPLTEQVSQNISRPRLWVVIIALSCSFLPDQML